MDENTTVGDFIENDTGKTIKGFVIFFGILVYLGMVVYSGVHNWRLMTRGLAPDMVIWAALGVVALEISAVFLPLGLHFWCHATTQKFMAYAFYALDLGLIFVNVVLDYAVVSGNQVIPQWMIAYQFYGVPATPVFAGIGWTLLFLLDPSSKERAARESLRASVRAVLSQKIIQAAKAADVTSSVDAAAQSLTRQIVGSTLGHSLQGPMPAPQIPAGVGNRHQELLGYPMQEVEGLAIPPDSMSVGNSLPTLPTPPGKNGDKPEPGVYNLATAALPLATAPVNLPNPITPPRV